MLVLPVSEAVPARCLLVRGSEQIHVWSLASTNYSMNGKLCPADPRPQSAGATGDVYSPQSHVQERLRRAAPHLSPPLHPSPPALIVVESSLVQPRDQHLQLFLVTDLAFLVNLPVLERYAYRLSLG